MIRSISISFVVILVCLTGCSTSRSVAKMNDGNEWTIKNLAIDLPGSFCYDNLAANCDKYGRLYPWKVATTACGQLGEGWRLPTNDEWKTLAAQYGGVFDDPNNDGKSAYIELMDGGSSKFNALLGGGADLEGKSRRVDAHGFYWTSTETSDSMAWFINFGHGRPALFLQNDGEKADAFSVRCIRTSHQ